MYKGYRNRLLGIDKSSSSQNRGVESLAHINKCSKCQRLNPSLYSPALRNMQNCLFCGNPFYLVKMGK
jgi:hypothetical protein